MNKAPRTGCLPKIAIIAVFVCIMVYSGVWLPILLARQEGLGIAAALRSALFASAEAHVALAMAIGGGLFGLLFYFLVFRSKATVSETATSVGAVRWRRLRLFVTIGMLPSVLLVAGRLLYLLVTGRALEEFDWMAIGLAVFCAAVVATYWVVKPAPEYLYALGTGDHSRILDERAQQVRGGAAHATLNIVVPVLLFGGMLYESLIRGEWPIRSAVELGLILLVYGLASLHWNRKL